jgi:hypothetical protein
VERYFKLNGVLPSVGYWIGAERSSASDPFALSDGSSVPQVGARHAELNALDCRHGGSSI